MQYEYAKEKYASLGVDTEEAMQKLSGIKISMHCWQGDDIKGFLFRDQEMCIRDSSDARRRRGHEYRQNL